MTNGQKLIAPLYGKLGECDADHRVVEFMRTHIKAVLDIYLDSTDANEEVLDALTDMADALGFITGPDDSGLEWRVEPKAFEDQVDFEEVE